MEAQVAALQAEVTGEEDELKVLQSKEEEKAKLTAQERAELSCLRKSRRPEPGERSLNDV